MSLVFMRGSEALQWMLQWRFWLCRRIFAVCSGLEYWGRRSLWVTYLQDIFSPKCVCGCKVLGTLLRFIGPVWECIVWKCPVHRVVPFGVLRVAWAVLGVSYSDSREISSAKMCISPSVTGVKYLYVYSLNTRIYIFMSHMFTSFTILHCLYCVCS